MSAKKPSFERGWLGLSIHDLTPELTRELSIGDDKGPYVKDVMKNGPADKAGIKSGDVILQFNRRPITKSIDLPPMVSACKPGDVALLLVLRKAHH
jgi:serine protease Do